MKLHLAAPCTYMKNFKKVNPKYFLETYYEIYKIKKDHILLEYIKEKPKDSFLLDSGAFTFMNKKTIDLNLDDYIENYIRFIVDYKIKYYFELDIDEKMGLEKVEFIRKCLKKETKIDPIPVWHKTRGVEYWEEMISKYNYVAMGLSGINETSKWARTNTLILKKMCHMAKNKNCKVHGLGYTRLKDMHKIGFYSVDSTSWKTCNRFGKIYKWDDLNKCMLTFNKPKGTRLVELNKMVIHTLKQWKKMSEYLEAF